MRVLIFHNLLWSQYKSIVFEKIAADLQQQGDQLLVVQSAIFEESRSDLVDFNLTNFPYKYPYILLSTEPLESVSAWKTGWAWLQEIIRFKPTLINFTGYFEPATLFIMLFAKIRGIRIVMTIESTDAQPTNDIAWIKFLKFVYKSLIFLSVDGFFSYGLQTNEYLFRQGIPKSKIVSYLNAFDQQRFLRPIGEQTESYLLYVGRLSPEKNIKSILALMALMPEQRLKIIGNGPQKQELLDLIQAQNLQNVALIGSVQWADLAPYYRGASCLLLPSSFEPWGMVANEAQSLGKPVICTAACGCANDLIIDGQNGLVVDDFENSLDRIAKYIRELPEKEAEIRAFSLNNSKIFRVDRLASEMIRGFFRV